MLSIIIVNYLQKDFLQKCVASIYKNLAKGSYDVTIVNNSKHEDLSEISLMFADVKIIPNENTGYSKGNNLGVKQTTGEYLLFLNADTEILSDFINDLINKLEKINYGAVGLRLQFPDGNFQNSFGFFPSILNEYKNRKTELAFKNKYEKVIQERKSEYSKVKEVDWVTGAAIFIKKEVFNKVNGFDERYFLYYEDIDLCYRLNKTGYKNYYYPFSEIIHYKGEVTRTIENKKLKNIQRESQKLYYKLHNGIIQQILLRIIHILI